MRDGVFLGSGIVSKPMMMDKDVNIHTEKSCSLFFCLFSGNKVSYR